MNSNCPWKHKRITRTCTIHINSNYPYLILSFVMTNELKCSWPNKNSTKKENCLADVIMLSRVGAWSKASQTGLMMTRNKNMIITHQLLLPNGFNTLVQSQSHTRPILPHHSTTSSAPGGSILRAQLGHLQPLSCSFLVRVQNGLCSVSRSSLEVQRHQPSSPCSFSDFKSFFFLSVISLFIV